MSKTKVYGFRMSPDKIKEFEESCHSLPISFKPNELLRGYVDYIIQTADNYKKTGHIKMGFISYDNTIVFCNLEGKQTQIHFEEDLKNEC